MKAKTIFILFILFISLGCKKEVFKSPYYFSCNIDGTFINFYPAVELGFNADRGTYAEFQNDSKRLYINGADGNGKYIDIIIEDTTNMVTSGYYPLSVRKVGIPHMSYKDFYANSRYSYYTDSVNTGNISITILKSDETIRGSFAATLKYEVSEKTITITDGKFFIPCNSY